MSTLYNPALSEEPRNKPMKIVPPVLRETLLGWLESTGRLRNNETDEFQDHKLAEDLDDFLEPEIYALEEDEEE